LRSFRCLKQLTHLRGKNVFAPLLAMKEVAVAALSQPKSVPRCHVVVSDAGVPCCFDRGIGVLVRNNLEFVAERNTTHREFERWFVMSFRITACSLRATGVPSHIRSLRPGGCFGKKPCRCRHGRPFESD